jgi:hypothetical protein
MKREFITTRKLKGIWDKNKKIPRFISEDNHENYFLK